MCTLSFGPAPEGYFVSFSRDELRTRAAGLGPRAIERGGLRVVLPIDADAGGSWIAANEAGTTVALLNGYRFQSAQAERAPPEAGWITRGRLVVELSDAADLGDVEGRIHGRDLWNFRPFELAAFDSSGAAALFSWNGIELLRRELGPADRPLVSSSFDDPGVRQARRALFARMVTPEAGEADVVRFHTSHDPERGPYSPCMHRPDAQTVSFTLVRVSAAAVEMRHRPGSPCATEEEQCVRLTRAGATRP